MLKKGDPVCSQVVKLDAARQRIADLEGTAGRQQTKQESSNEPCGRSKPGIGRPPGLAAVAPSRIVAAIGI